MADEEATAMPLRDHFRPPLSSRHSWEGFHALWPATLLQRLVPVLPPGFVVEPRVHDPETSESDDSVHVVDDSPPVAGPPTLTVETDLPGQDGYEVRVYDTEYGRRLVAAVEFVSPANKDRSESRQAFVAKCAALLQKNVCVSVVDIVTVRQFNLYADLLALIGKDDPTLGAEPPYLYVVTINGRKRHRKRAVLEVWFYPVTLGEPLPTLPLWLGADLAVPLDLEGSYEDACRVLRIA
jgi:hypothetical protein